VASEPPDRTATTDPPAFWTERLGVPWWMWPSALGFGALLATEVWLGTGGFRGWLPFAVLLPPLAVALWWLGRIRVSLSGGEFRVDDARLPVSFIADVVALDANGRREVLGVGANPLAFVVQRPWIGGAVQVLLDDPADPTPYWVVSTRHPVELATVLLAAKHRS
jgi:hypothetical protein